MNVADRFKETLLNNTVRKRRFKSYVLQKETVLSTQYSVRFVSAGNMKHKIRNMAAVDHFMKQLFNTMWPKSNILTALFENVKNVQDQDAVTDRQA